MKKTVLTKIETPAFVLDENQVLKALQSIKKIKKVPVSVLYTLKPLSNPDVLKIMKPFVDGFSASSLFEAKLANSITKNRDTIHITTPGFRPFEMGELDRFCGYIAFNSVPQLMQLKGFVKKAKIGLRINPELSFIKDDRYNPARKNSKLGAPLHSITPEVFKEITGLHFHTNYNARSFQPLLQTVRSIVKFFDHQLANLEWINLGGGYLFSEIEDFQPFYEAVNLLRSYGLDVFVEPGKAFVKTAGSIVSSVLDIFQNGKTQIAVLDTSVNHMPEVFEYQYSPKIIHKKKEGKFGYLLVGCSCLAGDIFGKYYFDKPLSINSKITFNHLGSYSHVKSHMFNGINLPNQYLLTAKGNLELKKKFVYKDFLSRC